MSVRRFQARIGRQTIRSSVGATTAADTRSTRTAMASIIKNYENFSKHMEEETPEVLIEALQPTKELAEKYTPKDTGKLVESSYLEKVSFRGITTVEIGFGKGGNPEYAATVHENLEFFHKSPTQAKFLQRALNEDENEVKNRIIFLLQEAAGI